jgi:hypothetical protein
MVALPVFFRHQIRRVLRTVRGQDEPDTEATGQDDATKRD